MVDSDSDDMPPPLEDMTEQVTAMQKKKGIQNQSKKVIEDEGEEIRLAPKKKPEAIPVKSTNSNVTRIMPTEESAP